MKKFIVIAILLLAAILGLQFFTPYKPLEYVKEILGIREIPNPEKQLNIFIRDGKFLPNSGAMSAGANVTWYVDDEKIHNIAGEGWTSGELFPGQDFSRKFSDKGTFNFHCANHESETGSIYIQ